MSINLVAVVGAGLFSIFFGYFWFGNLFRKFLDCHGAQAEKKPEINGATMAKSMGIGFISTTINCYIVAMILKFWNGAGEAMGGNTPTLYTTCLLAITLWIGFFLPFQLNKIAWEFEKWQVVVVNAAYDLIRILVIMMIFHRWA